MRVLLACFALASGALWAAPKQYQIETDITVDGLYESSYSLLVTDGQASVIATKSDKPATRTAMKVLATDLGGEDEEENLMMKFEIEHFRDGRLVRSSPQILARVGHPAVISVGDKEGQEALRLNVRAIHK